MKARLKIWIQNLHQTIPIQNASPQVSAKPSAGIATTIKTKQSIIMKKQLEIHPLSYFKKYLWCELTRYSKDEKILHSVTCTEHNIDNLFNSQYSDKTTYGEVYLYSHG